MYESRYVAGSKESLEEAPVSACLKTPPFLGVAASTALDKDIAVGVAIPKAIALRIKSRRVMRPSASFDLR